MTGAGSELGRVVVVLSAHLDDGIFSLGAAISKAARYGADVTVVTVLAGDPRSPADASGWDAACGFTSAAAAAAGRRREDQEACRRVGATPAWLPFDDVSYGSRPPDDEIWDALETHVAGADIVMVPGYPLAHPDHAWLARFVLDRALPGHVGLYLEQPYGFHHRGPIPAAAPEPIAGRAGTLRWRRLGAGRTDRRAKRLAIRAYRSQLPRLSRRRFLAARLSIHERRRGGETVAWIEG